MKLTNLTKRQIFLKSYAKNFGHITNSCAKINISRQTYYDWIKADKQFKQDVDDINNSFIDLAESALKKNMDAGMQKAIEFFLCNKKKDTYSNTIKNQLSGADGGPVSVTLREIVYKVPEKTKKENNEKPKTLDK